MICIKPFLLPAVPIKNMISKLVPLYIIINAYSLQCHKLFYKPLSEIIKESQASNHWALLVAGSDTWDNYRHQADICHAYQILRSRGMPAERIITMMVDDIAYNELNPFPGKIVNKPGGPNVYEGVAIDYRGRDVNPENFLAVLSGEEKVVSERGSGRVIKGGPNDHIFLNFVDHGSPAHISFPTKNLHRSALLKTIEKMAADKKFGQMVIYLEACYSGSMFKNMSSELNVYALTAANEHEPSYSCFYDETREAYIGDVFSVNWMQDSEEKRLDVDTLEDQYQVVKVKTNQSHVMQFGNMAITKEPLDEFQGRKRISRVSGRMISLPEPTDAIPSNEVPLTVLFRRLDNIKDPFKQIEIKTKIRKHIQKRDAVDETIRSIVHSVASKTNLDANQMLNAKRPVTSYQCYEHVVELFHKLCFETTKDGYVGKSLWKLVNLCEESIPGDIIAGAIFRVCR